jgi:hypothetical protein
MRFAARSRSEQRVDLRQHGRIRLGDARVLALVLVP